MIKTVPHTQISLYNLSRRAIDIVLSFLEDEFLLRLREVSANYFFARIFFLFQVNNVSRRTVDESIFRVRQMEIRCGLNFNVSMTISCFCVFTLSIFQAETDDLRMDFILDDGKALLWKIGVMHVLTQIVIQFDFDGEVFLKILIKECKKRYDIIFSQWTVSQNDFFKTC